MRLLLIVMKLWSNYNAHAYCGMFNQSQRTHGFMFITIFYTSTWLAQTAKDWCTHRNRKPLKHSSRRRSNLIIEFFWEQLLII